MKIQSVDFPNLASFAVTDVSCGQHHTIVLVKTVAVVDNKEVLQTGGKVYSWGDCSRGQLGSGDAVSRSHRSNLIRKMPEHYGPIWPDVPDDLPYYWPGKARA
jgi:alpha-tubulin suppressor-like RCC1 family protein